MKNLNTSDLMLGAVLVVIGAVLSAAAIAAADTPGPEVHVVTLEPVFIKGKRLNAHVVQLPQVVVTAKRTPALAAAAAAPTLN